METGIKKLFVLLASGCLFLATAAPPSIGFVKSNGTFRVDGSTIRGNSSLVEGNVVETTEARSVLQIGGVRIALLPDSRAKVYRDRTVFEKGSGIASSADQYVIEAAVVRVAPTTKDSIVQVELRGAASVAVTAQTGGASVRSGTGILLASLRSGEALAFEPQAGAAEAMNLSGVLEQKGGRFLLTDATSHVAVELQGPDLAKYVGQRVDISGSIIPGASPAAGAFQVVRVVSIKALPRAGAVVAGGGGLSGHAIGVIVGGIAVGGTAAGLAAAGTFSGGPAPASAK
jgi:hypothetical protein